MTRFFIWRAARVALVSLIFAAVLVWAAPGALGQDTPQQKDDSQDFFVFSARERARLYYDAKGAVSAVIVTYIGKSGDVPTPKAVLGSEVEARQDGSMYRLVQYPKAGYWVAYSRTTGDEPLTIITMQKMN
jgi:hypothetical protein